LPGFRPVKWLKSPFVILTGILLVLVVVFWSHMINWMLPPDSRPADIGFPEQIISLNDFEAAAAILESTASGASGEFQHIERFREAGILAYEGPPTCLGCHEEIKLKSLMGGEMSVDLMDNVTDSVHYRFFSKAHPNVYGFNGKLADNFPMGKVNRPCPKPGSFAMTAWAELVVTQAGDTLSEGCGQCHIGGQYQAPLGEIMPLYKTRSSEKNAIDCLICHAAVYDMNRKQVVTDPNGRHRWDQDRSLTAALSVVTPTAEACLRCHQHNFGGDIYIDPAGPEFMDSQRNPGHQRPRVMHPGSKRGTPFSPSWDVHAAAGLSCLDCHATRGHFIAKGTHTTTMMANDLPEVEVSCLDCHDEPHDSADEIGQALNDHLDSVACQTCHIPSLHPDNVTRRDFSETEFEADPGIHIYHDSVKENEPGRGIAYVWWNGDATFLGNPIGDNPNGAGLYNFYDAKERWPQFADFDYAGWFEEVMRPIARAGRPSKIHPMKRFNGRQHIDLQNIGPFGGMLVPYNLPAYYRFGSPDPAARVEMDRRLMRLLYARMFNFYMLDRFMSYMAVDSWNTHSYVDVRAGKKVEPRWLPTDAMMEINHAIRLDGALTCDNCHGPSGVMDWRALGYTREEFDKLSAPR